jgi:predicted nucleic acid-binding protein
MILALDTSALMRRYIADRDRPLVIKTMNEATEWGASALARTELQLALVQAASTPTDRDELWATVRSDWEAIWEVPVDGRCLARATEIGATYGLATIDAIHLAAADRLPGLVRFLTFERQQIPAAAELGFEVVSPYET